MRVPARTPPRPIPASSSNANEDRNHLIATEARHALPPNPSIATVIPRGVMAARFPQQRQQPKSGQQATTRAPRPAVPPAATGMKVVRIIDGAATTRVNKGVESGFAGTVAGRKRVSSARCVPGRGPPAAAGLRATGLGGGVFGESVFSVVRSNTKKAGALFLPALCLRFFVRCKGIILQSILRVLVIYLGVSRKNNTSHTFRFRVACTTSRL